jgi:hypothetical protein
LTRSTRPSTCAAPAGWRAGGRDDGETNSTFIVYLESQQGDATWLVTAASSNQAAPVELAMGKPVRRWAACRAPTRR